MTRVRLNPWQRFPASQREHLLAWVKVGNVGVLAHERGQACDRNGRPGVSLWCKTPALLVEACAAIGLPPSTKCDMEPLPHVLTVFGLPRERALDRCGHKRDARPRSDRR